MERRMSVTFLLILILTLLSLPAFASDGTNSCGYEMIVVPATGSATTGLDAINNQPAILDTWTTNDPFINPYSEVYNFAAGQDTLAFVVRYYHTGGALPEQWARGWRCGDETRIIKTCNFKWTIGYMPPGEYLLINYFSPVDFKPGEYDWASKVGNVVFGWPNIEATRPWCFTIH